MPGTDPRVERSRRLILAAALEMLGETGYGGLTVEAVACRAGVGKSTIYRQWAGKPELVEAALLTLKADLVPPTVGSVRERVSGFLEQVATRLADSTWSACLPAMIDGAERDPELLSVHRRFSHERRDSLIAVLAEGVITGEIPAALDLGMIADCLVGTIMVRRLLIHEPFDPAQVRDLVAQVLPVP